MKYKNVLKVLKVGILSVVLGLIGTSALASVKSFALLKKTKMIAIASAAKLSTIPANIRPDAELIPFASPVRITIPSIGVNAKVVGVGITSAGAMATPINFVDTGWYKYGVMPGEIGSAVIAGHYESSVNSAGYSKGGVFEKLHSVVNGNYIYVSSGKRTQRFVVTGSKVYKKNDSTKAVFQSNGLRQLTLITCNGQWLKKEKTFSQRLVVTAQLDEDYVNNNR